MNKKLGYYTCNGIEFESKIQGMMYSEIAKKPLQWWFNNEQFDAYNWAVEPELTLDQLYDARARQLRERYDYVILCYSGGSDSHNMLQSFVRQNLHIDEIVSNWTLDIAKDYTVLDTNQRETWNHNAEYHLHTKHRLNEIAKQIPKTKITVIDTSKTLLDTFINAKDASWVNDKKDVLNPYGTTNYNYTYFKEIRSQFDKGKSIAFVIGGDKPRLSIRNDKLYLAFNDKGVNMIQMQDHIKEYPNAEPVLFYWDGDCADMLCKQSHVVRKWIQANPSKKFAWESTDIKVIRHVQEEYLKTILYSNWNPTWFQVKKSTLDWNSELDRWFIEGRKNTTEHHIWLEGLRYVRDRIGSYLVNDNGTVRGSVPLYSHNYFIGDIAIR